MPLTRGAEDLFGKYTFSISRASPSSRCPRTPAETPMTQHPGVLTVEGPLDARQSLRIIKGLDAPQVGEATPPSAALDAPTLAGGGEARLGGQGQVGHASSTGR